MALSTDELEIITQLEQRAVQQFADDDLMSKYYDGQQRLDQIGLAVPPELARFETVVNWPRVVVDTLAHRQDVKALLRPGSDVADSGLHDLWRANNLDADLPLLLTDLYVYGRGFMSVGANEDDKDSPLITVESPREITVEIDARRRRISAALRLYDYKNWRARAATLYLPDATIWLSRDGGKWAETDRDEHRFGRVPVVMFLNRRRTGDWSGRSEMTDVIPLTDSAARSLTNLQLAGEALAVPQRYVLGASKGDFVDQHGNPLPAWEAYYGKFLALTNKDAKMGQLAGADLSNFHDTVRHYGQLASSVTGFPVRYFGLNTTNPPGEGAIRAEEAQLVKTVERKNAEIGGALGWVMGIAERFRSGDWIDNNRVHVEWHDPSTPTFAQKADALQKLAGGVPIISRQGAWDELGWSEARKSRELAYFEQETHDPYLGLLEEKAALNERSESSEIS